MTKKQLQQAIEAQVIAVAEAQEALRLEEVELYRLRGLEADRQREERRNGKLSPNALELLKELSLPDAVLVESYSYRFKHSYVLGNKDVNSATAQLLIKREVVRECPGLRSGYGGGQRSYYVISEHGRKRLSETKDAAN